jgi:flagellar hook-basal body complex protein FliE
MEISKIGGSVPSLAPKEMLQSDGTEKAGESFGSFLSKSFNDVNALMNTADVKANEMAVGKAESLHDAMIGFEKAETAFKLLVQVRNKAIDAYHEIMRMQV